MTTRSPRGGQTGARSLGDPPRKKRGLLWLLLGLLALAIIAAILIAALSGGDDDDGDTARTGTDAAQQATDAAPSSGGAVAGDSGTLTADGQSLLPVPADLSPRVGQQGRGDDVVVQKVSGQQGFWVGRSQADRVYVEYGAKVGGSEGGAEFKPEVGQKVDVTGPIRPTPEDPRQTLKVTDEGDIALLERQGGYINAETATAAG